MLIRTAGEDAYFAASNSAKGFFSYYEACFDSERIGHLYAVKGGPGTGKSRFLREVSARGREKGWRCEYIYCSSDPASLDGVILAKDGRGIALLDATAPHVYEPRLPGAREDLVNLGVFWDSDALEGERGRIECLQKQKKNAYRRAYHYLASAGELAAARELLVEDCVRRDIIGACAERLCDGIVSDGGFSSEVALMSSIGMSGRVWLDTYFVHAREMTLVEDCRGIGYRLLEALYAIAQERGVRVRVSYDPLIPMQLDAIAFPESGRTFAIAPRRICPKPHRRISARRFLDAKGMEKVGREATALSRAMRSMQNGALRAMEDVRSAHFALEEIYTGAMSFEGKERYTEIFCRELFDL